MRPIEIEILMKDGLTPGLEKAGKIVGQFSGESKSKLNEVTEALNSQREQVTRLENDLEELEKSISESTQAEDWTKTKQRIEEISRELETEKAVLAELIEKNNELKSSLDGADISLRQKYRNLIQEITALTVAYSELSDQEKISEEGRVLQRHIEDLTEKAGVLKDAMCDTAAAINNAASDTRGFDQLAGTIQLAIDSFGLATAGAEMFGVSQEDLVEVQTKLQSALVASNALSSVQNNLQRQSALMQGINIIQTKAAATAENIKTAAQGRGVIVTKAATLAQGAFNAVANANPYVLLATACVTVVGALYAFAKGSKAAKKAEQERQKQMEKAREEQEEFARAVATSAGEQIASFLKLKKAWENLGDCFDKKKKFITDTKEEWQKLGKEINNVNDMERMFRDHTKDMMTAIILRAELKAYGTRIQNAADKMVEDIEQNKKYRYIPATTETKFNDLSEAEKAAISDRDSAGNFTVGERSKRNMRSVAGFSSYWALSEEGAKIVTDMRKAAGNSAALAAQNDARANAERTISGYVDEMNRLAGQLETTMSNMPGQDVDPEGKPDKPANPDKSEKDDRVEQERRVAEELRKLRWKNQQEEIDQLEEGAEKRRRQVALDYEKQMAEIQDQEEKWRELQNGILTPDQTDTLAESRRLTNQGMQTAIREIEKEEVAKNREKLNELLEQYKDFDQRRRDLENSYAADMQVLNAELAQLEAEGLDSIPVESAISAREDAYRSSLTSLEGEILRSSDFYDKLFGTVSDKGYKVLKDFYTQAKETLEEAKVNGDGVEISIPVKDADGKFVKKAVKITVEEYRRMLKQVQDIRKQLEKDNPFAAFRTSWSELNKAVKEDGDVSGALKDLNSKGKEVTNTIRGWGESLGSVFGGNFNNSMNEILNFCDGAMDMGTGIAQIWSGDIVGGITSALSGLSSVISLFSSWKEKMEEMKREWYIAEIETNRALRERSAEYAANRSEISNIIKDVQLLNWLIETGFSKSSSVSVWDSQSAALDEYMNNLRKESAVYDELWSKIQGNQGHYEWGNSLNGGSATWSLKGANADMIELWYNQGKLSDEAKAYYEAWVDSGKSIKDLIEQITECKSSMREMVMGVSFDGFISNSASALKKMRGDVSELGKFTEDTLAEAILNGFMYRDLANVLEPLYNELTDAFIDGTADASYLEQWRLRYEEVMKSAGDRLDAIAGAAGVDLNGGYGTSQSGKAGVYTAMSQDQGTKLEGIGVSILLHTASIDDKMDDVSTRMSEAQESLRKIESNTAKSAEQLEKIADDLSIIKRDGIKTR